MATKKQTPCDTLAAAARNAIALLALGSPERVALARALNALKVQPVKAVRVSSKGHRYAHCFASHDEHCFCSKCAPIRNAVGGLVHGLMSAAGLVQSVKLLAPTAKPDVSHLQYCACTHAAIAHKEDDNGNLLKCGATGCKCDHFQYQHDQESEAA